MASTVLVHETENKRHKLKTGGDHSRKSRERRQMVPNKILSFSHLALIVILVIIINAFTTYGKFEYLILGGPWVDREQK